MIGSWYLLFPLLLPLAGGLAAAFVKPLAAKGRRNAMTLSVLLVTALSLMPVCLQGEMRLTLCTLSDNLTLFLRTDSIGCLFAVLMAFVWAAVGGYSFGYMAHEEHPRRFYAFYLCTLSALMGLCFAGSILTYYMFYELMTLLTVPLVMHEMDRAAVAAGMKYLIYSVVGASLVLLGVMLLSPYLNSLAFVSGGGLNLEKAAGHEGMVLTAAFLMLLGFGAKAGMFPLHGWLPTAHPAAPAPASSVLSGIITKAGVLGILRVLYQLVGADFLRGTWVQTALMSLALFTVLMGSLLAWWEKVLKKRLAWSTVSQVSYVVFGLSTLSPVGLVGALLHVVAHALIKNTLFMSAGSIIHQTGKTRVDELDGIGRRMPGTMWCFTLASVGLVGIPPCLGFVSKWYLAQGALGMTGVAGCFRYLGPAVLLVSALLTAAYLLPISIRAFFPGRAEGEESEKAPAQRQERCETPWGMLAPVVLVCALSVVLGMAPGALTGLNQYIAEGEMPAVQMEITETVDLSEEIPETQAAPETEPEA